CVSPARVSREPLHVRPSRYPRAWLSVVNGSARSCSATGAERATEKYHGRLFEVPSPRYGMPGEGQGSFDREDKWTRNARSQRDAAGFTSCLSSHLTTTSKAMSFVGCDRRCRRTRSRCSMGLLLALQSDECSAPVSRSRCRR